MPMAMAIAIAIAIAMAQTGRSASSSPMAGVTRASVRSPHQSSASPKSALPWMVLAPPAKKSDSTISTTPAWMPGAVLQAANAFGWLV